MRRSIRFWCGWRDLNPHGLRHQNLNLACLPIPPHPLGYQKRTVFSSQGTLERAFLYHPISGVQRKIRPPTRLSARLPDGFSPSPSSVACQNVAGREISAPSPFAFQFAHLSTLLSTAPSGRTRQSDGKAVLSRLGQHCRSRMASMFILHCTNQDGPPIYGLSNDAAALFDRRPPVRR